VKATGGEGMSKCHWIFKNIRDHSGMGHYTLEFECDYCGKKATTCATDPSYNEWGSDAMAEECVEVKA